MDKSLLQERSRIVTATRAFFLGRDYLETDTPILCPAPIPESCLELFPTRFENPFLGTADLWLAPSPEVWMKRVIAEKKASVFQICKCFRNAESIGRIHNPEFTMLEYYTVGARASDSIGVTEELFRACAGPDTPASSLPPFRVMGMAQAFSELAGLDLAALQDAGALADECRSKGLMVPDGQGWEDTFNQAFVNWIEPALPQDKPLVLRDYPFQVECLAANVPGTPWKDRWELYAGGMELANCYTELSEPEAVRAALIKEEGRKRAALFPHRVDLAYADVFRDFPPCSGVALGFDRFILALGGLVDIKDAILFPFEDTFRRWGNGR